MSDEHWTKTGIKDDTTKRNREDTQGLRLQRDKKLFESTSHVREKEAEKLKKVMLSS